MIEAQNAKYGVLVAPGAILDDASATSNALDCTGYDYLEVMVPIGATDIAMAALKLQECDTAGGTYTDIPGTTFGTDSDIEGSTTALPDDEADGEMVVFQVNLIGRLKYVKLVLTAGNGSTGTYANAVARLSRGDMPTTNAEAGALAVVRA